MWRVTYLRKDNFVGLVSPGSLQASNASLRSPFSARIQPEEPALKVKPRSYLPFYPSSGSLNLLVAVGYDYQAALDDFRNWLAS